MIWFRSACALAIFYFAALSAHAGWSVGVAGVWIVGHGATFTEACQDFGNQYANERVSAYGWTNAQFSITPDVVQLACKVHISADRGVNFNATAFGSHTIQGVLDTADCAVVQGWTWDWEMANSALSVDLYDGNLVVASASANLFRADLLAAGKGNGVHGFSVPLPPQMADGQMHTLSVKVGPVVLYNSPKTIQCAPASTIALIGPGSTKALPGGEVLVLRAVIQNGAAVAGKGVNISLGSGGAVSGITDSAGEFAFTYTPPAFATSDTITGTCSGCAAPATKTITVESAELMCPAQGN